MREFATYFFLSLVIQSSQNESNLKKAPCVRSAWMLVPLLFGLSRAVWKNHFCESKTLSWAFIHSSIDLSTYSILFLHQTLNQTSSISNNQPLSSTVAKASPKAKTWIHCLAFGVVGKEAKSLYVWQLFAISRPSVSYFFGAFLS